MKPYLLLLFWVCAGYSLYSQPGGISCYEKVRSDGIAFFNNKDYTNALAQFWAAKGCPDGPSNNDLDKRIKETSDALVAELNGRVRRAQEAQQKAQKAQSEAETARNAESEARKIAVANEKEAIRQGRMAESRRLALLADIARQRGEKADALMLSYLALQMAEGNEKEEIYAAFASAVKDSLSRILLVANEDIQQLHMLSGPADWMSAQTGSNLLLNDLLSPGQKLDKAQLLAAHWLGDDPIWVFRDEAGTKAFIWQPGMTTPIPLAGHTDRILYAAFSPDGQQVVTGSRDHTARLWSAKGNLVATITGHKGNVYQAAFSPNGQQFLTRSSDGAVGLWDNNGQPLGLLSQQGVYVYDACFSASGEQILLATVHGVQLWNNKGQLLKTIGQNSGTVKEVLFLQNDAVIAARQLGTSVSLWTISGDPVATLNHLGPVTGISADPQGKTLISWSEDQTARLWDTSGKLLKILSGHQGPVIQAGFSPDGQWILTTSQDGTSRLWSQSGLRLTEWPLGTSNPVPGVFVPKAGAILTAEQNNRTIVICPLPDLVLRQMQDHAGQHAVTISALQKKYDIRFL